MEKLVKILKALANDRRLQILKYLKKNHEVSVDEMAQNLNMSFAATSKHLLVLWRANILNRKQESFYGFYSLRKDQEPIVKDILSKI